MIGKNVSHYRITRQLGAGGMGVVYEAVDTKLNRSVALKFLPPELTSHAEAKARFVHEAQAASALDHPNVCTVYEIDETDDGQMFLAMACYEGETLKERIARGPLALDEAMDVTRQVADGLAKAHSQEIVHRDIKPANLFITSDGLVKILDFGLAKLEGQTKITRTGTTLGTASYMSPEQARGEETDARSDLWCLGVVLYEMVTGQVPFRGENAQAVINGIVTTEPEPVTGLRSGVPLELERIIGKCLAKDPRERYQHAEDLLADLRVLQRQTDEQPTATMFTGTEPSKPPRRWPWMLGFLGLGAILTVAAWFVWGPSGTPAPPVEQALAVIDFTDPADEEDLIRATGLRNLVHAGLVQNCPMRVVSPSLLQDIQRREFGGDGSRIELHQALAVARLAHASHLLSGHIAEFGDRLVFVWEMVETKDGRSIGAGRIPCDDFFNSAGVIVEDVLPKLAAAIDAELPSDRRDPTEFSTSSAEAYRYYTMGLIARANGRSGEGVRYLEKAVATDSLFALAHFELAKSTYGALSATQLDVVKSIHHREQALRLKGYLGSRDRLRLEAWLASVVLEPGWRQDYEELLRRWPDDLSIREDFIGWLYYLHFFEECIEIAEQGLVYYPDNAGFFTVHISLSSITGRLKEIDSMVAEVRDRFDDKALTWDRVGHVCLSLGRHADARTAFKRAYDLDNNQGDFEFRMAQIVFAEGDIAGSVQRLLAMMEDPDLDSGKRQWIIFSHQGVSDVLGQAGRYAKGHRLLAREIEAVPDENVQQLAWLTRARARLLLMEGRHQELVSMVEGIPRDSGVYTANLDFYRCRAEIALGRRDAALASLDSLRHRQQLGLRKAGTMARYAVADMEIIGGHPAAALDTLDLNIPQGALSYGIWGVDWHYLRARAFRVAGQWDKAVEEWRWLLRIFGGHALAHYELGKLYEEMDRPAEAAAEYDIFLDMWSRADEGLPQVEDATRRVEALRARI